MFPVARIGVAVTALWGAACAFAPSASSGVSLPRPVAEPPPDQVRSGQLSAAKIPTGQVASGVRGGAVDIAPLNSDPHGKSYAAWIAAWWKWALETEASDSPLLDPNSSNCAAGDQPSGVRFLGGTFTGGASEEVVRTCTIPGGTALFFPILNGVWASTPAPNAVCSPPVFANSWYNTTPADLGYQGFLTQIVEPVGVDPANPPGSLKLKVDGKSAKDLVSLYLVSDIFFDVDLPDDSFFDAIFGLDCFPAIVVSPNVGWGYYVFLNPLPPGLHTIRWKADATLPILGPLHQDVTYHLTVEPEDDENGGNDERDEGDEDDEGDEEE